MKLYHAMIWEADPTVPGKRVTVYADDLQEAKRKLEAEYGEGRVFNLYNEEDANRIREMCRAACRARTKVPHFWNEAASCAVAARCLCSTIRCL